MFCDITSYNTCLNAVFRRYTAPQSFCHSLTALSMRIRCLKSAQKSAIQICQVAAVVIETTQLVLSQFKNFLSYSIENCVRSVYARNN